MFHFNSNKEGGQCNYVSKDEPSHQRAIGDKRDSDMGCNVKIVSFLGLGSFILIAGIVLGSTWPLIFSSVLKNELVLSPDSKSYDLWKDTPLPLYMEFYMFNWTNAQASIEHQEIPHFIEMGPYVFREFHTKVNLTWNLNSTVTFQQIRRWTFDESKSHGKLTDTVTNINVIAMTIGNIIKKNVPKQWLPWLDRLISIEEPLYITKTVGELLFDGYNDPFLKLVTKLKKYMPKDFQFPFDKFGWFYGRNMSSTYDGIFNMYTGSSDINTLGNVFAWNYTRNTKYYDDKCGLIDGTTGELWPTDAAYQDSANIFSSDICSSLLLTEKKRSVQIMGLYGTEFSGNGDVFIGSSCYCIDGVCPMSGAREISTCRYGAPAYISYPHFYLADPRYNKMVSGLSPSEAKHKFKLVLHEESGVPLQVDAKLQVNILSQPLSGVKFFEKAPNAMMPMVWFNQHAMISSGLSGQLQVLRTLNTLIQPLMFGLAGLGLILTAVGGVFWYSGKKKSPDKDHLIPQASE